MWTRLIIAATVFALVAPIPYRAAEESKEKAAESAAVKWLALVDSGKYEESWSQASELFRQAITQEQWKQTLEKVRTPLGKLESRKLTIATHTTQLPGAPAGEFVVVQFSTHYENKKDAVETITPMLEKDGTWRVSGYFVK